MLVTLSGMETLVRQKQPKKAYLPMLVTPGSITILDGDIPHGVVVIYLPVSSFTL